MQQMVKKPSAVFSFLNILAHHHKLGFISILTGAPVQPQPQSIIKCQPRNLVMNQYFVKKH